MPFDAEDWLRALPPALQAQRELTAALLNHARADSRIRAFIVGCSLGRGVADALSDVDALIGVRPDHWDEVLLESQRWVDDVGPTIDVYQELIPDASFEGRAYQHTSAFYRSGAQLDLVVARLADVWRPRPGWVVLYDPDAMIRGELHRRMPEAEDLRRWVYSALVRLSACAKYLQRGSPWEAHLCLERARADYWCVLAVAEHVPDPQYGLTAILDDERSGLVRVAARTVATLDIHTLRAACIALVELLAEAWPRAASAVGDTSAALPPLAADVRRRLSATVA